MTDRVARRTVVAAAILAAAVAGQESPFHFDREDRTVAATVLPGSERYDADVALVGSQTWLTWLTFEPGKGDHIWIQKTGAGSAVRVTDLAGRFACPTLTVDANRLWLSYERHDPATGRWDVVARPIEASGTVGAPRVVSGDSPRNIRHTAAAHPNGGLWIAWQADDRGQFDVVACRLTDEPSPPETLSRSLRGDWHPSVAVAPNGTACVVWDTYDAGSYDVVGRWHRDGEWTDVTAIATGPSLQARARVACGRDGRWWIAWEEGSENWGHPYRSVLGTWNNARDDHGPLHRFRELRLAVANDRGGVRKITPPIPMPALDRARVEPRRAGADRLGCYYERPELAVDGFGRPWLAYRHFANAQIASEDPVVHHVEEGHRIHARCLTHRGWSELIAFDVPQRDGMQRLAVVPRTDGIAAIWGTGRTDRRTDGRPRGLAIAGTALTEGTAPDDRCDRDPEIAALGQRPSRPRPAPARVGEPTMHLFFGDLHRHTDLSLCFPFFDGSIDDAYRYAIDAAELDFLGITDHTRDIAHGDALGQLWWRSTKEVTRHRLTGRFFPYFSFERSHRHTDHNVISLRSDMLRDFPPPLQEFWNEIDDDQTITIPHNPFLGQVWKSQDDAKRPLLEIYQGCRDQESSAHAHEGLGLGYRMGFIASSDHMSTGASYACVWAPEASRESIFAALRDRRTYAATSPIRMVFRAGDHWMGSRLDLTDPTFELEVDGTAELTRAVVILDGEPVRELGVEGARVRNSFSLDAGAGPHWAYVHVVQEDGNQAWSSPIWFGR